MLVSVVLVMPLRPRQTVTSGVVDIATHVVQAIIMCSAAILILHSQPRTSLINMGLLAFQVRHDFKQCNIFNTQHNLTLFQKPVC